MLNLPYDIVFKIFSYLETNDFVRFTKAAKLTFQFMTSPARDQLWRTIRIRDELVPFPELSNSPFVLLMHDKACQTCDRHNNIVTDWTRLERRCQMCQDSRSASLVDFQRMQNGLAHPLLSRVLEPVSQRNDGSRYDLQEMIDMNDKLSELGDQDEVAKQHGKAAGFSSVGLSGGTRSRKLKVHGQPDQFVSKLEKFLRERKDALSTAERRARVFTEAHRMKARHSKQLERARLAELDVQRRRGAEERRRAEVTECQSRRRDKALRRRDLRIEKRARAVERQQDLRIRWTFVREQLLLEGASEAVLQGYEQYTTDTDSHTDSMVERDHDWMRPPTRPFSDDEQGTLAYPAR
ncbi:hypothetical protein OIV83_005972 [Microbotryomycetes sp. JL201]|nr:hypothetical protein OIV83_005972 [Microbotryomycetes sp. JL201]